MELPISSEPVPSEGPGLEEDAGPGKRRSAGQGSRGSAWSLPQSPGRSCRPVELACVNSMCSGQTEGTDAEAKERQELFLLGNVPEGLGGRREECHRFPRPRHWSRLAVSGWWLLFLPSLLIPLQYVAFKLLHVAIAHVCTHELTAHTHVQTCIHSCVHKPTAHRHTRRHTSVPTGPALPCRRGGGSFRGPCAGSRCPLGPAGSQHEWVLGRSPPAPSAVLGGRMSAAWTLRAGGLVPGSWAQRAPHCRSQGCPCLRSLQGEAERENGQPWPQPSEGSWSPHSQGQSGSHRDP